MTLSQRNEKVFYIAEFFNGLIFHMPVWVAYELQFITLGQMAIIEAVMQMSQLLSELPTGAIADLLGKKASVIIGRIIGVISLLMYATTTSFAGFIWYAIVSGIGDSFVSGAKDALLYDSLKQDKREAHYTKASSKLSLIFQLSFAMAILLGGILSLWGYTTAIYASVISYSIVLILSFWLKEPALDTEKFTLPRYIRQFREGFRELFKSPYVRDISLFYIGVGGVTWSAMMLFNTSLLTTIGYTTFQIGIIVAAIRLLNSSVLFGALHLNTLVTKRRAYLVFPVIMMLCYLPGVFLTKELAILAVGGSIFASSARWVILGGYVNEHYDSKNRATALSTLSMLVAFAVVGFALVSSPIMQYFGDVKAVYTLLGIATTLTILPLGLRIRRRYHAPSFTAQ
ncbi:MFS transporter [Candidatus Gottesmanbacteria bacterium]|nr:MFS transporter [Candidatus Gottesmanbacteria bacterium]